MTELVDSAIAFLRGKGLRVTEQRKAILEVLARSDSPISAEETYALLPDKSCDLVTAYRCLEQNQKIHDLQRADRQKPTNK